MLSWQLHATTRETPHKNIFNMAAMNDLLVARPPPFCAVNAKNCGIARGQTFACCIEEYKKSEYIIKKNLHSRIFIALVLFQ